MVMPRHFGVGSLLGAAGPLMVARVVALLAGVLGVLLSARLFGPEGRGILAAFAVLQFIGATGLSLGTGSGAFLGTHRGTLSPRQAGTGILAIAVCLGLGTAIVAGLAWRAGIWSVAVPGTSLPVALALGPAVAGQYLVLGTSQIAMGVGATTRAGVALVLGPVLQLGSVGIAAVGGLDIPALLLLLAGAWTITGLAFVGTGAGVDRPSVSRARELVRLGRAAALGDLTNALSYRLDVLLVVALAGSATAGVYSVATQFMEPLWVLASSVAGGLLITFRGETVEARAARTAAAAIRVGALTILGAAGVILALPIASSFAGRGFGDVAVVGAALGPGIVLLGVAKILAAYQTSLGRLWIGSTVATLALVGSVVADLILIPTFGAVGAAAGATIGYGLACVMWLIAFRATRPRDPVEHPRTIVAAPDR